MATQSDLVTRVLQELNVLVAGETPASADNTVVVDAIGEVHAELQERRLAYWATSAIPDAVMRGLTLVVAGNVARKFIPTVSVSDCEQMREIGMRRIREVIAMQNDNQATPQTYF